MERNVLELDNVGRSFGSTPIFKGVDLTATKGDAVAILGPSGMGKTTLLRIMGTIDTPTEGTVHICGKDVSRLSKGELADLRWTSLGYAFQEALLIPGMSSLDNVLLPCLPRVKGEEMRTYREKALRLLEDFGLGDRVRYKPHQLSVGQRKRVDLARALVNDPDLLIIDEPTTNLDAESSGIIAERMKAILGEGGTIVLTTHQDQNLLDMAGVKLRIQDYQDY